MKTPSSNADQRRAAIGTWLAQTFTFTHFITLASNTSGVSLRVMRDRIKAWDARVNRELYGPKWLKHYDELLWFFAFLEKPDTNPHWHLLCRFEDQDKLQRLMPVADRVWRRLLPSGSVDLQEIKERPERLIDYVVKRSGGEVEYSNFITPDEYRRYC